MTTAQIQALRTFRFLVRWTGPIVDGHAAKLDRIHNVAAHDVREARRLLRETCDQPMIAPIGYSYRIVRARMLPIGCAEDMRATEKYFADHAAAA